MNLHQQDRGRPANDVILLITYGQLANSQTAASEQQPATSPKPPAQQPTNSRPVNQPTDYLQPALQRKNKPALSQQPAASKPATNNRSASKELLAKAQSSRQQPTSQHPAEQQASRSASQPATEPASRQQPAGWQPAP